MFVMWTPQCGGLGAWRDLDNSATMWLSIVEENVDGGDDDDKSRWCRLADSWAQPCESSENCGGTLCTANPQTALHASFDKGIIVLLLATLDAFCTTNPRNALHALFKDLLLIMLNKTPAANLQSALTKSHVLAFHIVLKEAFWTLNLQTSLHCCI